ncbi:MAG TPA: MltA domain-containing protein [Acidocella sp.]|nr:MltA domain-containing protein [Acidocella sp.]
MRLLWFLPLIALAGCVQPQMGALQQTPGAPPITAMAVETLPGWSSDDTAAALTTFVQSCKALALMPADQSLGGIGIAKQTAGQAGLWQNACQGAKDVAPGDTAAARQFFKDYFIAYRIDGNALITGYFEPEHPGSKNYAPGYTVPIYAKPFDAKLANLPRAAIDDNALYRKAPVTAYLTNPVDAFMLQIQGAGRIRLPNGSTLRVGFDGQNGEPYTPIGRILVANGDLAANDVSFQSISAWLKAHPSQARGIMEQNARYVYLKPLGGLPDNEGAPGALGVPLTAGRSLAVDTAVIPLGLPVFLATTDPITQATIDRLTIAQDTGGGIHGAAAADLFFGAGPQAEAIAGRMQQPGQLYMLLPRPTPKT